MGISEKTKASKEKWAKIDYAYIWKLNIKGNRHPYCKCGKLRDENYGWCHECRRAYARKYQKEHPEKRKTEKFRWQQRARNKTQYWVKAGKIKK